MSHRYRELIGSARADDFEDHLRDLATRALGEELTPLEVRHLRRILTSPALVLSELLDVVQFGDLVDAHFVPDAFRSLSADAADEASLRRALAVPDHVRLLGDKCLFETGVARRQGPRGLDLADLGRRSYLKAARVLDSLADDSRLRQYYEQAALEPTCLDDEVAHLARCADRFTAHVRLLRSLLHEDDAALLPRSRAREDETDRQAALPAAEGRPAPTRASGADDASATRDDGAADERKTPPAARTGTALAERPPATLGRPTPSDEGRDPSEAPPRAKGPHLKIVARTDEEIHEQQLRDLIAAERTVLFSALDTELLRSELKRLVVHQDGAIDSLCDELALYSAGTQDPKKPASYFLIGPTGVGKNHLVETLCSLFEELWGVEVPYLELEGPEFTYPSDINELKGAARGFIRSDEEGIMTQFHQRAHDKPFSVILIDEVEKAHPQLRRFFLPIMDRGTMMDNRGRTLHFHATTIFYTSNIGYSDSSQRPAPMGFGDEVSVERANRQFVEQQIKRTLSPEFINRVHLVHFAHLTEGAVDLIFDLEFGRIRGRYRSAQGLDLVVTPAARAEILRLGYNREYGARNLAKVLNRHANIEVSKTLKRDEHRELADVSDVLSWIREMRDGKVAMDVEEVRREVAEASKIQVPYRRVVIDFAGGEFTYAKS